MKKKQIENKLNIFTPSLNFTSPNEVQQNQIKGILNRSKTPFYRKKSAISQEEENFSSGTLNKSINNQTFIYNSINFNNQGLFNNINNTNNNNNNHKRRKSGGNSYMVNNGIMGFFETMKKSRSISKQKNNSHKYMNIINKLTNNSLFYKSINKHKNKSNSKQKNNSFKNDKKKINTLMNTNTNINNGATYANNTNTLHRKNKNKLMSTNYNINKNLNMINVINNNNKINHILASSTGKTKKVKKNTDINLTNKEVNTNKNKINLIKNIQFIDSDRNNEIRRFKYSEENKTIITEFEKNILYQIESLILKLLTYCSSPKNIIIKELENILKKALGKYNINFKIENDSLIPFKKKSNKNLNFSKNGSKNNLISELKKSNNKDNIYKNNKNVIENELNILNKKYNQIKEENNNLKYLITEKTSAFEDVKNSLKNFQIEINQLKNNKTENNSINQNPNSLRNKNEDYNIDSSIAGNISLNSKGVEMKNIKFNLSNIQKLNEIQDLPGTKDKYINKKEAQENNTDANTNKDNNIFNCNNYSFGQNNSFEINLENYSSQKNILNSNRSLDPLSLTFHEQTINADDDGNEIKQKNFEKEIREYDISPSMRKNTEALIKTGIIPTNGKKF